MALPRVCHNKASNVAFTRVVGGLAKSCAPNLHLERLTLRVIQRPIVHIVGPKRSGFPLERRNRTQFHVAPHQFSVDSFCCGQPFFFVCVAFQMLQLATWTTEDELVACAGGDVSADAYRRRLRNSSQELFFGRPLHTPPEPLIRRRKKHSNRAVIEYISFKHLFRERLCFLCGGSIADWSLIGGGYQANWFAALLKDVFPLVMCEACFRVELDRQNPSQVTLVGMAVLPQIHCVSMRQVHRERFLLDLHHNHTRKDGVVDLDQLRSFLSHDEIHELVYVKRILFRTLVLRAQHVVGVSYCVFRPTAGCGVIVSLSRQQAHPRNVVGFMMDTQVEVVFPSSYLPAVRRRVADFFWLRDRLERHLSCMCPQALWRIPLLPQADIILGFFSEEFLNTRIASLHAFLVNVALDDEMRACPAVPAFFKPAFSVAKAIAETTMEEDEKRSVQLVRAIPEPSEWHQDYQDLRLKSRLKTLDQCRVSSYKLNKALLGLFHEDCGKLEVEKLHDDEDHFLSQLGEASYRTSNLRNFVENQVKVAQLQDAWWRHVLDMLNV